MGLRSASRHWGSSPAERAMPYPCDRHVSDPDDELFRAVDVEAPAAVVFRWLCQLRAAPYSYDLLDNFGRRSPQQLTPGLDRLATGQRVMTIFELVEFEQDHQLTIKVGRGWLMRELAVTYLVAEVGEGRSRLLVKLRAAHRGDPIRGFVAQRLLPMGDLVMMRRQLLNLKQLAEGTWAEERAGK